MDTTEIFDQAYSALEEQKYEIAFSLFTEAAQADFSLAQYFLAWCYEQGMGVEETPEQAVFWWKKAAESGYVLAQISLGSAYEDGYGFKSDYSEAHYWYSKAVALGNEEESYSASLSLAKLLPKMTENEIANSAEKQNWGH